MRRLLLSKFLLAFIIASVFISCGEQTTYTSQDFKEGTDYIVYERVRILDKMGFAEPQEAYSLLLPRGWQHQGDIVWVGPGNACAATYKHFKAASADGNYRLQMYPEVTYSWTTNPDLQRFNQEHTNSPYCGNRQPIEAEAYLRQVFAAELGNPEVIKVEPNKYVIQEMEQSNAQIKSEMMRYGAGDIQFNPSAINAVVRWPGGAEGLVTLGVRIMETTVPNVYDGTYSKSYTMTVKHRSVFLYPATESEKVKNQFSVIMSSIRSNPAWDNAVGNFWKAVRERKHVDNIGTISMIDERTRQIGNETIRRGNEQLKNMDTQMRSWEMQQSAQDRTHTNFIKTIREVENFRDETGKYEMTSSYTHAWSRNDGTSFVMSNNPNFDPAFVLKDQAWKEMKKVD